METESIPEAGRRTVAEADRIWRENPIPVVLGALATGLVIGLVLRAAERDRADVLKDRLEETEGFLHDLVGSLTKATKKGYRKSADAVKDAVESAVDAARDIDVDDYVDPANKWLKKIWKRCCS
jgi:hypothetical protein